MQSKTESYDKNKGVSLHIKLVPNFWIVITLGKEIILHVQN